MTPEIQRIAIAQACGWKWTRNYVTNSAGLVMSQASIPDYLNDLNAMHEAEKVLLSSQKRGYANMLVDVHPLHYDPRVPNALNPDQSMDLFLIVNMTAAQRAEAFLKTIGKWENDK